MKTKLPPSSAPVRSQAALFPISLSLPASALGSNQITSVLWLCFSLPAFYDPTRHLIRSVNSFRTTFSEAGTETPSPTESHHFHNGLFIFSSETVMIVTGQNPPSKEHRSTSLRNMHPHIYSFPHWTCQYGISGTGLYRVCVLLRLVLASILDLDVGKVTANWLSVAQGAWAA